jgi:hypothetical protein
MESGDPPGGQLFPGWGHSALAKNLREVPGQMLPAQGIIGSPRKNIRNQYG